MRFPYRVPRGCLVTTRGNAASSLSRLLALWLACAAAAGQSQTVLQDAQAALGRKDYKTAEGLYRKALSAEPNSPELLSDLGIALQLQGRSSDAIHYFQEALKRKYLPGTYALLAEERCRSGDLNAARPMLAKILREDTKTPRLLVPVAPCFLDLDEPVESVEVYQALTNDPAFPQDLAHVRLAKSYLRSAQFFGHLLKSSPGSDVYTQAIEQARAAGSANARSAFATASQASPYFHPQLNLLQAVSVWRDHPNDTALLYQLNVLSGEESMKQIQYCVDTYPDSPYVGQLQADILAAQGNDDEAMSKYAFLMQSDPDLPELRYSFGMLYRKRGEWDKALALFQQQLAADPNDGRAAARVSEALVKLARYEQVRAFLAPRVAIQDAPLWARLDLATAERELGDYARAIQQLVVAEKDVPADTSVHYRLMRLYMMTGDTANAARERALCRGTTN
jgi:tetratricopeptide (TPR) repeat protein